jgi:hypothetical protein
MSEGHPFVGWPFLMIMCYSSFVMKEHLKNKVMTGRTATTWWLLWTHNSLSPSSASLLHIHTPSSHCTAFRHISTKTENRHSTNCSTFISSHIITNKKHFCLVMHLWGTLYLKQNEHALIIFQYLPHLRSTAVAKHKANIQSKYNQ